METLKLERRPGKRDRLSVSSYGRPLLNHPVYNKGSAFSQEERQRFRLRGLLPPHVGTLEEQCARNYASITRKQDPLEQYIGLVALQGRNTTLFYRVLLEHLEEFLPIVYTPTVGLACQQYSRIFRRAQGLWITPDDRGNIYEVLGHAPFADVRLIVVTDNERILGLGDQGMGGMGIPIGKLALYTLGAGIHPTETLPVSLDVGTDNEALLKDDLYLGWRHPRLRGEEYDALVDEFVDAVKRRFPHALLQWEDFKKQNAIDLLDRYRDSILSFNDDIQGTAGVALAGVLAAMRVTKIPLNEQRILILGAGAAGLGIARQLRDALKRSGLQGESLERAVGVMDSRGLLTQSRSIKEEYKKELAWSDAAVSSCKLKEGELKEITALIEKIKPTVLIGTSGQPGVFTESIVRAMGKHTKRPAIFPFSNPTSKSEAIPQDLLEWTEGRALIATGSPFDPVNYQGKEYCISQGNNVYIFPGVGLGAIAANAKTISEAMFTIAAETLAAETSEADLQTGKLFPRLKNLRDITAKIAANIMREASVKESEIDTKLTSMMWYPEYPELVDDFSK